MPEPCFLRSALFAEHGLHGIFSLRCGGVSRRPYDSLNLADDTGDDTSSVQQNLAILLGQSGVNAEPHRARQVHGCDILMCSGAGMQHSGQADILISRDGSPVAVRVADCTPILLADPVSGISAAVHAGWRGTAAGAVMHAVRALLTEGAKADNIVACIGPCIGPCCFEIGGDTGEALRQSCPGADAFVHSRDSRLYADLSAINRVQLEHAGIGRDHIEVLAEHLTGDGNAACTCCNSAHFFSYRRDGKASGRHLAIVAPKASA